MSAMVKYKDKLPAKAFISNEKKMYAGPPGNAPPPVIAIVLGEEGYYPVYTDATAEHLNANHGVTEAQAKAMMFGSMFGWDTEASNPEYHSKEKT